mgnify:CR=1 FL=1
MVEVLLVERLARAKGVVAEGLSWALLHLRRAALEAGQRLAREGLLDAADDALYMPLTEIEQLLVVRGGHAPDPLAFARFAP